MLFAAVIAAAWVALTVRRPEVTYHLAPLIAAGSAPLATRQQSRPHRSRTSLITGAVSTTLVLVALTFSLNIAAIALRQRLAKRNRR